MTFAYLCTMVALGTFLMINRESNVPIYVYGMFTGYELERAVLLLTSSYDIGQ